MGLIERQDPIHDELIKHDKPYMINCSPMCVLFAQIQNIINKQRDTDVAKRELDEAMDNVRFVMRLCANHVRDNYCFVFEHPATATYLGKWQR